MKILTPAQAAELLGVSVHSLRTWRSTKKHDIPSFKIGGLVKYDEEALLQYIKEQKQEKK